MRSKKPVRLGTRDMAYAAAFAVLTAVCSWISIPSVVPFTMQTFAVFCAVLMLGGMRGTLAVLTYVALGAAGLPVFSGFTGGVGILFGATGGYITGFLALSAVYWLVTKRFGDTPKASLAALLGGLVLLYAFGTAWFMAAYAGKAQPVSLAGALGWCVFPFIVPDLIKLSLAVLLSRRLKPLIRRYLS